MLTRRSFTLCLTSSAFAGLALSGCATSRESPGSRAVPGYGPLAPDPAGLIDLPQGFSYRIISAFGERMDDGFRVPDRADGMGAFRLDDRRLALVRNHELTPGHQDGSAFHGEAPADLAAFDRQRGAPLPGGTTTIVYDYRAGRIEQQYLSLAGTIRNCAGGTMPWGSWLSCEEDVSRAGSGLGRDHGWCSRCRRRAAASPIQCR